MSLNSPSFTLDAHETKDPLVHSTKESSNQHINLLIPQQQQQQPEESMPTTPTSQTNNINAHPTEFYSVSLSNPSLYTSNSQEEMSITSSLLERKGAMHGNKAYTKKPSTQTQQVVGNIDNTNWTIRDELGHVPSFEDMLKPNRSHITVKVTLTPSKFLRKM
jgi:hypothetical protein